MTITPIDSERGDWSGTYIRFHRDTIWPETHKTNRWLVAGGRGDNLGVVSWFPAWRKYAFFPAADTVFEEVCLTEIAEFCKLRTQEHKAKKA
jgi:hypothetical protein